MYKFDNDGIGSGPYLNMAQCKENYFTQKDLDQGLSACALAGDNIIGKNYDDARRLFGKVVWVSNEYIEGTEIPAFVAVQARGVARFVHSGGVPICGLGLRANKDGSVTATRTFHGVGAVVAANDKTCDVWLG